MTTDLFISYSRKDKEFARKLVDKFTLSGRDAWIDVEDIAPAAHWREEIFNNIDSALYFICIISPDWLSSEICNYELEHARKHNKRIVPIIYREVEEREGRFVEKIRAALYKQPWQDLAEQNWEELKSLNWLMFRETDDFEESFKKLLAISTLDNPYLLYHTVLLSRARAWELHPNDPALLLRGGELREAENWLKLNDKEQPAPTDAHKEYIAASMNERSRIEQAKAKRLEQEAERDRKLQETAEEAKRNAQLVAEARLQLREAAEQSRKIQRRLITRLIVFVLLVVALGVVAFGLSQTRDADSPFPINNTIDNSMIQTAAMLTATVITFTPTATAGMTGTARIGEQHGSIPLGGGEIWTYSGKSREVIIIQVNADKPANNVSEVLRIEQGLLDTNFVLRAPDGHILQQIDDIHPGILTDSLLENYTLPVDGVYQIEVRGWGNVTGGGYTLIIESYGAGTPIPPTLASTVTKPPALATTPTS